MDDKKKLTDCHFYATSSCSKGENCVFRHLHTPATAETTKICKFWRQEICDNAECAYRHPTLPRAADGSLIMCVYEVHGGCARREFCPYAHKYEAKSSIPGLSTEEQSTRLQIPLNPPSSEPRFVARATPETTQPETAAKETQPSNANTAVEPPPKKLKIDNVPLRTPRKTNSIPSLDGPSQTGSKPQPVSFVKSFQEIMKQREMEEKEKGEKGKAQESDKLIISVAVENSPKQNQVRTAQQPQQQAAGKGKKRKVAEPAAKPAPQKEAPAKKTLKTKEKQTPKQSAAKGGRPSLQKQPEAPKSFVIKSLGELMKEREGAQKTEEGKDLTNLATSAAASGEKATVGEKRKLEEIQTTKSATTTTTTTPSTTTTTTTVAATTTATKSDESFEDLDKELEELKQLGVDIGDVDVDVDVDVEDFDLNV